MARYIDESTLVKAILCERDKIPLRIPCAPYELCCDKPNSEGQAQRAGIRKALRCIHNAPTADVAPKTETAREIFAEIDIIREETTGGNIMRLSFFHRLAELKKKYIGE